MLELHRAVPHIARVPPPKVSVCLDVFNYARFLPRAIESVLGQTFPDFELIIADDCSTDGSSEIAAQATDPRVRVLRNPTNLGMVRNRNIALAAARGEFVKPLHADDFLPSPNALAAMVALLESNGALSLAASTMQFVSADEEPVGTWRRFDASRLLSGPGVIQRCLAEQRNLIGGPSAVMFRRAVAGRGFDESFFHMADLEMWFHLLEKGCFGFSDEPLCAYRRHENQQTGKDRATLSEANDYAGLLERYLDQPYVTLKPWMKAYLRGEAQLQRARRSRELGLALPSLSLGFRFRQSAARFAMRQARFVARHVAPRWRSAPRELPPGVNVAGFFQSEHGIGDSSRAFARVMGASGVPCALINIRSKVHHNAVTDFPASSRANPYRVNLMTFSFDYARRFQRDMGRRFFAGRYNIALWYWELETLPARWHTCFDYYDEIWVVTEFCRRAIAEVSPIPVTKIPYPLWNQTTAPNRSAFGIDPGTCVFLFTFDHLSVIERKNPVAVIAAFKRAFDAHDRAVLIFKTINAAHDERGREALHRAADGANVRFLEEHISEAEMNTLTASCDCYISLHRAEGLGLGMAQAMAAGKPVIATGYSGNLDFMDATNSLLVRGAMVELRENFGPYPRGSRWAEPDVTHAADQMRWVFDHRPEATGLGLRAANDIRARLDPEKAKAAIVSRLRELHLVP